MKYDIHQKPSKFAERVLADFSSTLFSLLQGKNLKMNNLSLKPKN